MPEENVVEITPTSIYHFLSLAAKVASSVALVILAFEVMRVTYADDEGHYIMHIGTHDVH